MRRFDGRVALVTGAAHGIGRAVAARLVDEGASVVIADVELDAGTAAAAELGDAAVAVGCDVTSDDDVRGAVDLAVERFGRLDVLVNNVGGSTQAGPFEAATTDGWRRQFDLTVQGVVRCTRQALPHLLRAPAGGSVVTIGSVNGLTAIGDEAYSAAKAALVNLTRNLAVRYGPDGVRFNLVAPGTVRTRVWDDQPGQLDRLVRLYPLGRVGEPADIAAAVAFLASDDAAWITGVALPVDGGLLTGAANQTALDG